MNHWLDSCQDVKLGYSKELIRFCDFDLIFKVEAVEKLQIYGGGISVFSENTFLFIWRLIQPEFTMQEVFSERFSNPIKIILFLRILLYIHVTFSNAINTFWYVI